jgi:hypothetical protein
MSGAHGWNEPGHFYSPLPSRSDVEREVARAERHGHHWPPGVDMRTDEQVRFAHALIEHFDRTDIVDEPTPGRRYFARNDFYPFGDALVLDFVLRRARPRRVIEVGSGFSSAALLDTLERHVDVATECTFVEPYPQRLESLLSPADRARHRVLVQPVQDVPLAAFERLQANDVLLVDSSHVSKAGSDVNFLFLEVLPRLASGVWVHVHDVVWPFTYPRPWLEEGRAWNEAYMLHAFLAFNSAFAIEFWAGYVLTLELAKLRERAPRLANALGSAVWLRRL